MFNFEFENPFSKRSEPKPQEGMGGSRSIQGIEEIAADELMGVEKKELEPNERFEKILKGVEKVMPEVIKSMKKDGASIENIMDYQDVFIQRLREIGAIKGDDMSFSPTEDALRQAIKSVTRSGYDRFRSELRT